MCVYVLADYMYMYVCMHMWEGECVRERGREKDFYVLAYVHVQAALLYTNLKGERRLRVHNMALNCSTKYQDIYRSCEIDTLINYFSKSSKFLDYFYGCI